MNRRFRQPEPIR
jgi:hypothetical protein